MKARVGFLGPLGTYTHQAAYEYFHDSAIYHEQKTIKETLESLDTLDYAVVPRENSIFGSVIETFDGLKTLKRGTIQGEVVLKIQHCLVARKGAKFSDIDCVISHEQALGQCQKFLARHLPSATTSSTISTAAAAQKVSKSQSLNVAAICSEICVTTFEGLEVLEKGIQDEDSNYTRFFVLSRNHGSNQSFTHVLLRITPRKTCAEHFDLTELLRTIDLSVTRIDRRPAPVSEPFLDTYFIEVAASKNDTSGWPDRLSNSISRLKERGHLAERIGQW
ncbi:Prephenate dehydratase-domain-containing protein [Lentinula raphanica]|nr:Prephenate dehydratase-domain-containing protein [Lentinula raphanica]KAJ3777990.1 Prephenate dehydratase-domain-containing protein [Lentinula raphanica]KAJ3823352.1 Prephenate dehydratase-domain-containing protein [Lentinula raphanica]